jgi:hypothetical protein
MRALLAVVLTAITATSGTIVGCGEEGGVGRLCGGRPLTYILDNSGPT